MVEFGYTEAVSMGLVLPLDCPVTVKTDLVVITVMLKVEFTVSRAITNEAGDEDVAGRDKDGEFSTIRIDLPCDVVHVEDGKDDIERHLSGVASIRTIQQFWKDNHKSGGDYFDDTDIQSDLKMLSLHMIGDMIDVQGR